MDVLVLGGFLGSGKTTLLLEIAELVQRDSPGLVPVAVLENEIGKFGIDDEMIRDKGYAVRTMLSGCACCTLSGDLPVAVKSIIDDFSPSLLVIESTGLSVPGEIKRNLNVALGIEARICTLVDATRWRAMLIPAKTLLKQQLIEADIVCVNKIDCVDDSELDYIDKTLDKFNDSSRRIRISACSELPQDIVSMLMGSASEGGQH